MKRLVLGFFCLVIIATLAITPYYINIAKYQTEAFVVGGATGISTATQTALDLRCLESVFGTSISTGLLLESAALKVSAILQKYHAIDPSANMQTFLANASFALMRADLDLEAATDFYSKTAEDTWRASVTQTIMGYLQPVTGNIQAALDLKLTIANPTFTGTLTVGSASPTEPDLEIIDDAAAGGLTHTELMYLKDFTGVTGSGSLVGHNAPTFVDPILGAATATSITLDAAANPGWIYRDSDGAGTDKTAGDSGAGFSTTTDGGEISDLHWGALGAGTAGTSYTHLFWDGSDSHLYMGVLAHYTGANPSVAPLDVGTYESLVWDFDHDTDTVKVTSPVSATNTLLFGLTAGSLNAPIVITENTVLSNDQVLGRYILMTAACTATLPAISSCGVGAMICVMVRDAAEQAIIDSNGADTIYLRDGTSVGDGDSIDIPAGAKHFVVLWAADAVGWYILGESDTCTDGGAS